MRGENTGIGRYRCLGRKKCYYGPISEIFSVFVPGICLEARTGHDNLVRSLSDTYLVRDFLAAG
jgi:hypothetical protein